MADFRNPYLTEKILLDLSPVDLAAACKTDRNTFAICNNETFWKRKYRRDFKELLKLRDNWKDSYLLRASIYGEYAVHSIDFLQKDMEEYVENLGSYIIDEYGLEIDNYYMFASSEEQARELYEEYIESGETSVLSREFKSSLQRYKETGEHDRILNFYYGYYFVDFNHTLSSNLEEEYSQQLGIPEIYDSRFFVEISKLAYDSQERKMYLSPDQFSIVDARFYRLGEVQNQELIELDPKIIDDRIFDLIITQLEIFDKKMAVDVFVEIHPDPLFKQYRIHIYVEYDNTFGERTTIGPFSRTEIIALIAKLVPRVRFSKLNEVRKYLNDDTLPSASEVKKNIFMEIDAISRRNTFALTVASYYDSFQQDLPTLVKPKLDQVIKRYSENDQLTIPVRKLMEILVMELQYVI